MGLDQTVGAFNQKPPALFILEELLDLFPNLRFELTGRDAKRPTIVCFFEKTAVSVAAHLKRTDSAQIKRTWLEMGKKYPLRTIPMTAHNG